MISSCQRQFYKLKKKIWNWIKKRFSSYYMIKMFWVINALIILAIHLNKCSGISTFPIGDKGHASIPDQTCTKHPHMHEPVQPTGGWKLHSAALRPRVELQATMRRVEKWREQKDGSFSRRFMGYIHNDRAKMYNRRQQVSENETGSHGPPSTLTHFLWMGEGGGGWGGWWWC